MQAYSDPRRESDQHALPDVEVWHDDTRQCEHCGTLYPWNFAHEQAVCPSCKKPSDWTRCEEFPRGAWWWWTCLPGCLPDGDPVGPFATEAEALADAQADALEDDE